MRPLLLLTYATVFCLAAFPALAQTCAPRDQWVERLTEVFGESLVALGIGPDGRMVMEIFVSPSGTWTVLITAPGTLSCGVASGEAWTRFPLPEEKIKGEAS